MTKQELIKEYAYKANLSQEKSKTLINDFLEVVGDALVRGGELPLSGFGRFTVKETPERVGRNPKTGEPMKIPARNNVKFKAGKFLAEKVNK